MPENHNLLSEALRRERKRRKETQRDAALRFGVSQPSYFQWEDGKAAPKDEHRRAIADYLGVSVGDIHEMLHEGSATSHTEVLARLAALERDVEDLRSQLARLCKQS